jgi:hypothetical protein
MSFGMRCTRALDANRMYCAQAPAQSVRFGYGAADEIKRRLLTLWNSIRRLEPLRPKYVSVTYGAGGSTRERTIRTVGRILRESRQTPAAD